MATNYLTVVFEYENGAELPEKITSAFVENEDFHGAKIKTMSRGNEKSKNQTNVQSKTDAIHLKADLETIRIAALIPKSYTPENRTLMYKIVGTLIVGVILFKLFVFK